MYDMQSSCLCIGGGGGWVVGVANALGVVVDGWLVWQMQWGGMFQVHFRQVPQRSLVQASSTIALLSSASPSALQQVLEVQQVLGTDGLFWLSTEAGSCPRHLAESRHPGAPHCAAGPWRVSSSCAYPKRPLLPSLPRPGSRRPMSTHALQQGQQAQQRNRIARAPGPGSCSRAGSLFVQLSLQGLQAAPVLQWTAGARQWSGGFGACRWCPCAPSGPTFQALAGSRRRPQPSCDPQPLPRRPCLLSQPGSCCQRCTGTKKSHTTTCTCTPS